MVVHCCDQPSADKLRRPTQEEACDAAISLMIERSRNPVLAVTGGLWIHPITWIEKEPPEGMDRPGVVVPGLQNDPEHYPGHCRNAREIRQSIDMLWVLRAPFVSVIWNSEETGELYGCVIDATTGQLVRLTEETPEDACRSVSRELGWWPGSTPEIDAFPVITEEEAMEALRHLQGAFGRMRKSTGIPLPSAIFGIGRTDRIKALSGKRATFRSTVDGSELTEPPPHNGVTIMPPGPGIDAFRMAGYGADYLVTVESGIQSRTSTFEDLAAKTAAVRGGLAPRDLPDAEEAVVIQLLRCEPEGNVTIGSWQAIVTGDELGDFLPMQIFHRENGATVVGVPRREPPPREVPPPTDDEPSSDAAELN